MQIEIKMNLDDTLPIFGAPDYIADTLKTISDELKSGTHCTGFSYHMYRNLRDNNGNVVGAWRLSK